ncbi:MAG: M48 family metallopeptidase [Planctomycetota bacterium]
MKFRPRLKSETADISRGGKEGWRSRLKGIASAVIVLGAIYFGLGFVAAWAVHWIPPQTEADWFSWSEDLFGDTEAVPEDVQTLFQQLLADEGLSDFPYRLVLLDTEEINAFALPGGTIGVTQGLLDTVTTDMGRALVLGHEIGHVEHRHGMERLGRSILLAGAMSLVGVDVSGVLQGSLDIADLGFSRNQESECDDFGLRLVHRRIGTTVGAMEFFEKLQFLDGGTEVEFGERMSGFLRTHPITADRLRDLEALAAELEAGSSAD